MDKSDADSNACKFFSKARTISVLSPFSYNQEFGKEWEDLEKPQKVSVKWVNLWQM